MRIELGARHAVEALGRLKIALVALRPKLPRIAANGIRGKQLEAASLFHPQLKLLFPLENPDEHGIAARQALSGEPLIEPGEVRRTWKGPAKLRMEKALRVVNGEADAANSLLAAPRQPKPKQQAHGRGQYTGKCYAKKNPDD